jgi:hypothetical protein
MIRYSLKCEAGHGFESWFKNADAFSALKSAQQVTCPVCGTNHVEKSLMAPAVRPARMAEAEDARASASKSDRIDLSAPQSELEVAIATLRRQIEENSDYVGMNFATEARRMHLGEVPERAIHGEARPEEARKLIEDGVPVAPLPFLPTRKAN